MSVSSRQFLFVSLLERTYKKKKKKKKKLRKWGGPSRPSDGLALLLHTHQGADGACLLLSTACLLLSTACLLLSTAYRFLLSIAYRLPSCLLLPLTRLLTIVYRLPALPVGAALVIAHTRVADRITYPYGMWDCLCYSRSVSHTGLPTHARPSC